MAGMSVSPTKYPPPPPPSEVSSTRTPQISLAPNVFITRSHGIPVLDLHNLQGIDATALLQMLFELLEQCSDSDATRSSDCKEEAEPRACRSSPQQPGLLENFHLGFFPGLFAGGVRSESERRPHVART